MKMLCAQLLLALSMRDKLLANRGAIGAPGAQPACNYLWESIVHE